MVSLSCEQSRARLLMGLILVSCGAFCGAKRGRHARGPSEANSQSIFWQYLPQSGSRSAPIEGGQPRPNVPQWMVTAWMPPDQGKGRDNRYVGNGIRIDQHHMLLPDAITKQVDKQVPERDHLLRRDKYQPANYFVDMNRDKVSVADGPNNDKQRMFLLDPIMPNMENSGIGVYHMTKEENFTGQIPPLKYRPRLETDPNNYGADGTCTVMGYSTSAGQSRQAGAAPDERVWAEFPVSVDKNQCNGLTCRLSAAPGSGLCKGSGDRGLPVFCGMPGNRKITYMTKGITEQPASADCTNTRIQAVHVAKLDAQIKHATAPGPPTPDSWINPNTTYVPASLGGSAWNPVVNWFSNLG